MKVIMKCRYCFFNSSTSLVNGKILFCDSDTDGVGAADTVFQDERYNDFATSYALPHPPWA